MASAKLARERNPLPSRRKGEGLERVVAIAAVILLAITFTAIWRGRAELDRLNFATALHLATLIPALALTPLLFWGMKGARRHRQLGYAWCALMMATAVAAFFIRDINDGRLSFIHIFVAGTLVSVPRLIANARRHRVEHHRGVAIGLTSGGLLVAGITAYLGERHLTTWLTG